MHMNSAPHLLAEDRPEYERILDDALRHAHERPDLAGVGERLNAVQLRTMALDATELITSTAATEYQHYVRAREELRNPAEGRTRTRPPGPRPTVRTGRAPAWAPSSRSWHPCSPVPRRSYSC